MSYIIGEDYVDKYEYVHSLSHENHKFTAKEWHKKYKQHCFYIFGFCCLDCDIKIYPSDGVVHHLTYKQMGGIYQFPPEKIMDKICILCHDCHEKRHQKESVDGLTKLLPKNEFFNCCECNEGFEQESYLLSSGRCEVCENVYQDMMSSYEDN